MCNEWEVGKYLSLCPIVNSSSSFSLRVLIHTISTDAQIIKEKGGEEKKTPNKLGSWLPRMICKLKTHSHLAY